ncbi:MAG: trypsin-like serine protease, partial [Actinomycetota bacterium]
MRKILVTSAAVAVALAVGQPVGAANGPLDGNAHPNMGVMLVLDADGEPFEFCGGVLISPTVFLTNYNCPRAVAFARSIGGRAVITFEPVLPWPPEGPAFRTVEAGYVHPDANGNNGTNLYGIAVLARPVRGIMPAELPTLHQLASIEKGDPLTLVGYGDNSRRSATVEIAKIDPEMITLLNNTSATDQGGACDDGGSPYFLGDSNVVVAVADGETGRCNAISWAFRNDIETARSFFDDFVSV